MGLEPLLLEDLELAGVGLLDLIEEVVDAFLSLHLVPKTPAGELMRTDVVPA